jgi:hypothetical protein
MAFRPGSPTPGPPTHPSSVWRGPQRARCWRVGLLAMPKKSRRAAPSLFDPARCARPERRTRRIEPRPQRARRWLAGVEHRTGTLSEPLSPAGVEDRTRGPSKPSLPGAHICPVLADVGNRFLNRQSSITARNLCPGHFNQARKSEGAWLLAMPKKSRRAAPSLFDPARCARPERRTRRIEPGPQRARRWFAGVEHRTGTLSEPLSPAGVEDRTRGPSEPSLPGAHICPVLADVGNRPVIPA